MPNTVGNLDQATAASVMNTQLKLVLDTGLAADLEFHAGQTAPWLSSDKSSSPPDWECDGVRKISQIEALMRGGIRGAGALEMIRRLRIIAAIVSTLLSIPPALAEVQPELPPVLRLETGMHTAPIRAAAVDAAGQMLATVSNDKTARLWSLSSGELIRVLRPEIGRGPEGQLFAVAMSSDARFVVTGGWTGFEREKANSIYVFETATGRLVRRVGGFPQVINRLAWSSDGRYVAVGLAGTNGIRLLQTSDWSEVAKDVDYAGPVYGLSFDGSGHLAVAAFDGNIRLYDSGLRPIAKAKAPGGARPASVAFSPNGSTLAVGYNDTLNVDVLSVPELRQVAAANVSGLSGGNLDQVAWARDGALLAGGAYWSDGSPIFRWADSRRAIRATLAAANGTVMGIVPLPDGGFVYVTGDPTFGRYDARLKRILYRRSDIADLRGQFERLRLSADGAQIAFGLEKDGGEPAWFDADARMLDTGRPPGDMRPADVTSIPVRDWRNTFAPMLSGRPLALEKNETSRSVAIAPDRRSFALGTDWYLRRFGSDGEEIWRVPVPAAAWAIDVSRDGRLVVAALADGTIRWYRHEDGRLLLTLFPHRDGRRWVLWTPKGFYDSSPGGEDLVGWHVDRGLDHEADFFPASRFRDRFYRPELVGAVLRTLDVEKAQQETESPSKPSPKPSAPLVLPPVIRILSPGAGEEVSRSPVEVRYSVRSPSGEPVTAVDMLVDGRPPAGARGLTRIDGGSAALAAPDAERAGSLSVPLAQDATITLVARAGERTSEAASVKVIWKGNAETKTDVPKPKLYVLAIGVSRYEDSNLTLRYAAADAGDVVAALKSQEGRLYDAVVIKLLRDDEATLRNVTEALDWIAQQATSRDVALVFLAGHGMDDEGKYYFLPTDVDLDRLRRTAEPQSDIDESLQRIAGKALFFFDTCHSGSVMGGRRGVAPDINGVVNDLASAENGVVVFAASTGRESAFEREAWGHGAFSFALLEALTGKAGVFHDGVITLASLEYWLAERVKKLTEGHQHTTSAKPNTIRDFPIAVIGPSVPADRPGGKESND
jgi:WD40 repeat protein